MPSSRAHLRDFGDPTATVLASDAPIRPWLFVHEHIAFSALDRSQMADIHGVPEKKALGGSEADDGRTSLLRLVLGALHVPRYNVHKEDVSKS